MKRKWILGFLVILSGNVFADKAQHEVYDYTFPAGTATPFDSWNRNTELVDNPDDKAAAEFAAKFASKMMVLVTQIENTKDGKRALVIVANQRCIVDMAKQGAEFRVIATRCSTKPFGKF